MKISNTWTDKGWGGYLLACLALILCACTGGNVPDSPESDFLIAFAGNDSTALFRGHDMGDAPEAVRTDEKSVSVFDTDTLMEFVQTLVLDSAEIEVVSYYTFDDFGLFEMQFDLFPEAGQVVDRIRPKFEAYLTERFGQPDRLGISRRWTTVGTSNSRVEILLTDESADFGRPFLSLNFYESIEDEI